MRILHISECIKGGVGTYLNELYNNKHSNFNYHLFIPENEVQYISQKIKKNNDFTTFKREKRNLSFLIFFFIFIRNNIKKINPDIIHLHSSFAGFIVRFYYIFKFKQPKMIYCPHGWSFLMDTNIIKRKIFFWIELFLSIKTDFIINISDYEYNQSTYLGISKKKSIIIKNGINKKLNDSDSKVLFYHNNKINFLFVGRNNQAKGFKELYHYFNNKTDYILHVVGNFIHDNNTKYKNSENIFFYGWIDNENIHNYYIQSDYVIIPSRWEAFGLVGIEAMKYSKPLIVSNRGALKELIKEGVNGYIFDFDNFNNSLNTIIMKLNSTDVKKLGENSFIRFNEKYSIEKTIERINKLYNSLIK